MVLSWQKKESMNLKTDPYRLWNMKTERKGMKENK